MAIPAGIPLRLQQLAWIEEPQLMRLCRTGEILPNGVALPGRGGCD